MRTALFAFVPVSLLSLLIALPALPAQDEKPAPPPLPAATLGLSDHIAWITDGQEYYEHDRQQLAVKIDRGALIDEACGKAKAQGKLVLWYVHRILEKTLGGRQMYRAPVLDIYARQVLFADPDVSELVSNAFVPVRCVMDQKLSDRFGLKPLAFVEPAVVFLDGDGKVVHFVERIRTFHGQWFADLCVRVLDHAKVKRSGDTVDALRQQGLWREALALASQQEPKDGAVWLSIARLQRLLRLPDQALDSVQKARTAAAPAPAAGTEGAPAPRRARPGRAQQNVIGDAACEEGLILAMTGKLLEAQPLFEQAWRSTSARAAEGGYWFALNALKLGDEVGAMRRFSLVATKFPDSLFGKRARANSTLGPDERPLGAAFTGFEAVRYLPEAAYLGLQKDTTWQGDKLSGPAMARGAVEFLLSQQRDDGGFTDARYAYWPDSEITPNVWVAITAIALTALLEERAAHPDLQPRIDRALQRGEAFILDPKRLNRGANEDCYSDAYRLMYFARRANDAIDNSDAVRRTAIVHMNEIVQAAALRQKPSGFWAHEYENAFATGAVLQEMLAAKAAGATVPTEVTDKAASALISARHDNGTYAYGGAAGKGRPTGLKDASGRMPVCEGTLLQLGRSDFDKLRFALQNFWDHMKNLEGVRRNDFHSDGELGGFFFFHSVFHASEVVRLLPAEEQAPHWPKFLALLQQIPEFDGSFLDSHEFGRSYGTAMALLTLRNCTR